MAIRCLSPNAQFSLKKAFQALFSINWILIALNMIHLSYKVITGLTKRRF